MPPEISRLGEMVIGGVIGMIVISILTNIASAYRAESQKRIITGFAITNGFILELGFSPMGRVVSELVPLSFLPTTTSTLVQSLVAVATLFEILFGAGKMWGGSGWLGIISFVVAFAGGSMIPYRETILVGVLLILVSSLLMEAAPANQWSNRGL